MRIPEGVCEYVRLTRSEMKKNFNKPHHAFPKFSELDLHHISARSLQDAPILQISQGWPNINGAVNNVTANGYTAGYIISYQR